MLRAKDSKPTQFAEMPGVPLRMPPVRAEDELKDLQSAPAAANDMPPAPMGAMPPIATGALDAQLEEVMPAKFDTPPGDMPTTEKAGKGVPLHRLQLDVGPFAWSCRRNVVGVAWACVWRSCGAGGVRVVEPVCA